MTNPVGAPMGNKNGLKNEYPSDRFLHLRVQGIKKAEYVRAAKNENMKLAEWILKALDSELLKNNT